MGDFFLLATDATAQLLLRRCEEGACEWEGVWGWEPAAWHEKVALWRRDAEQVVRGLGFLFRRGPGAQHREVAVELHGVGVDDLGVQSPGALTNGSQNEKATFDLVWHIDQA